MSASEQLAAPFGVYSASDAASAPLMPWSDRTPYEQWCEAQGIPIVKGFYVADLTAKGVGKVDGHASKSSAHTHGSRRSPPPSEP